MARRLIRLVVITAVAWGAVRGSTFGWKSWGLQRDPIMAHETSLADRLKVHVRTLSQEIGDRNMTRYPQLLQAAQYINDQFVASGYQVQRHSYRVEGKTVENLIAVLPGSAPSDEVLIVGAHYDSCFNPGADDNASGIAGLLEMARLSAAHRPARTIKWIAFVNEEPPYFQTEAMGSWVYAKDALARGEHLHAAIILEMLGYYTTQSFSQRYPPLLGFGRPHRGNFIGVVGNVPSRGLVKQVTRAFQRHARVPIQSVATFASIPGVSWSDHWSFWRAGYPAVMVTDTAFLRNPHYHAVTDTWETLDYSTMAAVVEGLVAVVQELR